MTVNERAAGFAGLRVAAFESRHAEAMKQLILNNGGVPLVAPSMREIPLEQNTEALQFADELCAGRIDMLILLTGVGARFLTKVAETKYSREQWIEALSRVTLVARGPKPVAVLKEMGLSPALTAPEPNTSRDLLAAIDGHDLGKKLSGSMVAVQEYGVSNDELINALRSRGAKVLPVRVYQWDLPVDTGPLRNLISEIAAGKCEVVMFTTSVQVHHLIRLASEMGLKSDLLDSLNNMIIASIGPTTTETLSEEIRPPDLEASHPKMGILVKETGERSAELLARGRARNGV